MDEAALYGGKKGGIIAALFVFLRCTFCESQARFDAFISMTKRYFTPLLSIRSNAPLNKNLCAHGYSESAIISAIWHFRYHKLIIAKVL
jgi:energy-converting hydrogenase Eha subunit B